MAVGLINDWQKAFSFQAMQAKMAYDLTHNCESQVLAIDGSNAENIQTTGTKMAVLNGTPLVVAADAEFDVSASAPYAAWVTATAYTTVSEVTVVDGDDTKHFVCISAHTSGATTEPLSGDSWETYWRYLPQFATKAVGDVVAETHTGWYLACVKSDGVLELFKAHNAYTLEIPVYDPTRYVPVGLISVTPTSGSYTCGTTALTTIGTFYQLTGVVYPAFSLLV